MAFTSDDDLAVQMAIATTIGPTSMIAATAKNFDIWYASRLIGSPLMYAILHVQCLDTTSQLLDCISNPIERTAAHYEDVLMRLNQIVMRALSEGLSTVSQQLLVWIAKHMPPCDKSAFNDRMLHHQPFPLDAFGTDSCL